MTPKLPVKIQTARLELRPLRLSDHKTWQSGYLARKNRVARHDLKVPANATFSRKEFVSLVERHRQGAKNDQFYVLGIFNRRTGEYLGHVDLAVIRRSRMQWGNLGYALLNQHYGQGFGREAVKAALRAGFTHLGFQRLEAVISPDNTRSARLARDIGMRRECKRRAFIFEAGEWRDHVVYAATPEDFGLKNWPPNLRRR